MSTFRSLSADDCPPQDHPDLFDPNTVFEEPSAGVEMTAADYRAALAAYYGWALKSLERHQASMVRAMDDGGRKKKEEHEKQKTAARLLKMVKARARTSASCHAEEQARRCRQCGRLHGVGWPRTKCDSQSCPWCAPVRGRAWVSALRSFVQRHPPEEPVLYSECSVSLPKSRGLSIARLRLDLERLHRTWDHLWDNVWSTAWPSPGHTVVEPGPGVLARLEVSASGTVHLHGTRRGRFVPDSYALSFVREWEVVAVPQAIESNTLWSETQGSAKDVEDWERYAEKGASLGGGSNEDTTRRYLHPLLHVLVEIAFFDRQRHFAKGAMRPVKRTYDAQQRERVVGQEHDHCAHCGSDDLVLHTGPAPAVRDTAESLQRGFDLHAAEVDEEARKAGHPRPFDKPPKGRP